MRTQTIVRELYQFDELSDDAKENARSWMREREAQDGFDYAAEWRASLEAWERIAPLRVLDWRYGGGQTWADYDWCGEDGAEFLSGVRAWKWLQNNGWLDLARENAPGGCTLTGFCADCPLFDPIAEIADHPEQTPELSELFGECVWRWLRAFEQDDECRFEDDSIDEMIRCNEYEFLETGEIA